MGDRGSQERKWRMTACDESALSFIYWTTAWSHSFWWITWPADGIGKCLGSKYWSVHYHKKCWIIIEVTIIIFFFFLFVDVIPNNNETSYYFLYFQRPKPVFCLTELSSYRCFFVVVAYVFQKMCRLFWHKLLKCEGSINRSIYIYFNCKKQSDILYLFKKVKKDIWWIALKSVVGVSKNAFAALK